MTIKEFIEKAIEGGWNSHLKKDVDIVDGKITAVVSVANIGYKFLATVLDPKAWEAVGKVEGWGDEPCEDENGVTNGYFQPVAFSKMHVMIDALCDGKTLEEYLETL